MKAPQAELVTKGKLATSPKRESQTPLSAILTRHDGQLSGKALYTSAGVEIEGFYRQLKAEMAMGRLVEPEKARMIEEDVSSDTMEVV